MSNRPCLAAFALVVELMAPGCTDTKSARVEVWQGGSWHPAAVTAFDVSGRRDGAQTSATYNFTLQDGARLEMELKIVYNPTPAIGEGRWRLGPEGGDVTAESLKFLGGQGEGPSLGGRFRLDAAGTPRFRVQVPPRPLG